MVFQDYAKFYDLLYQDKEYHKECSFIISLLTQIAPKAKKILELGSGTGRHGRLLAQDGYQIHGIERSQNMIEVGKASESEASPQRSSSNGFFSCIRGDALTTQVGSEFDVALALFHVFSYQMKDEQAVEMFSNAHRHLKNGGVFILDYWFAPAVHQIVPAIKVKRVMNDVLAITRIAEPDYSPQSNHIDVNYLTYAEDLLSGEIQKNEECHAMRAFEIEEIEAFANLCGFELIKSAGWMTSSLPSTKTWSAYSIFKKN
jgi:SAM-dependent methyltransferase